MKEEKALLSGDHVMGWSTAVISPPDGNMADYFASLRKLLPREETLYIPTHGSEIRNPNPFVQVYIEHRLGREAQIMARLKDGPQTIPQMVAKNYADTPIHLHAAAGRSMLAHLIQMVKDGRVKTDDGKARARQRLSALRERDPSSSSSPSYGGGVKEGAGHSAGNSPFQIMISSSERSSLRLSPSLYPPP